MLGGEHHGGVARVYAGVLNVFADGIFNHLALVGHSVELYLFGVLHELAHHNGEFLAHFGGHVEETVQLLVVVANVHGGAREHVAGAYEHRVAHFIDKLLHVVERGECAPCGLVDAQLVEHGGELVAVFGAVDVDGAGAQHGNSLAMEFHGQVVGYLSAHADDDASWRLEVDDVEHTLEREFVEVETVAHVVVGGDGLRVVVDHDALVAQAAGCVDGVDRAPVELHRRADAIGARAEHHHRLVVLVVVDIVARLVVLQGGCGAVACGELVLEGGYVGVGEVEIVCQFGMLAGHCGNALDRRQDVALLAILPDGEVFLLHVSAAGFQHEAGNLEVAESALFHFEQESVGNVLQPVVLLQFVLQVNDMLEPLEEPNVNLGQLLNSLHAVALFKGLGDGEDAQVGGVGQLGVEIVESGVVVAHESVHALANHAEAFLNHFLERAADGHDFAHRLHRRADETAHAGELGEVPAGNLANHVVQLRSHVGRARGTHFANLVERVAQGNLGGYEGQRIARGL